MDLASLIDALRQPTAYPDPVDAVEVRQTHISVVFLAGSLVYKLKKPVNLGFLDFSTVEKRRHFCDEEVRLNRRLAPEVYLGVVPVTATAGRVKLEGEGEVIDWVVKMQRLPEEATLLRRLQRGEVGVELLEVLAHKLARFHAEAEAGPRIATFGRFESVAQNIRENFAQSAPQVGITVSRPVFDRLRILHEEVLVAQRPLIEQRAAQGVPRDTHGDLHLDHIYLFPEKRPPADLVIIDCIEFNERFRYGDPVADMAFLTMDLTFQGRRDLAQAFAEAYFRSAGDGPGRDLLPLYVAYRAVVRGKVEGFALTEKEIPEAERARALTQSRAHWLLALAELERPERRPCLVLVAGLPGAGKSTLAQSLAEKTGFQVIRSDVVRKELAGQAAEKQEVSPLGEGLYTAAWTERTYAECLRRAEQLLFEGQRVLVDANFRQEQHRRLFLEAAVRWGVPVRLLVCQADPETIRNRLAQRREGPSDADWSIYQQLAGQWEEPSPVSRRALRVISTNGTREEALAKALQALHSIV